MIAPDVRMNVHTGQKDMKNGPACTGAGETGRSSSDPKAGAPQRRARNGLNTVPGFAPLPPYIPLDPLQPKSEQKELPELTISDEQLFAIQKLVAFETQQWEARSDISKV